MAVHPKVSFFGASLGVIIGVGTGLFLLGRATVGVGLTQMLFGVAGGLAVLTVAGIAIVRSLPVGRRLDGLLLEDSQPSWDGYISATPRADLVGKQGVAVTELRPVGMATIEGERVDVTTEGDWLPSGTALTVVKAEAMRLVVRRATQLTS